MIIWNPPSESTSKKIEAIQKRYLKFLYYKLFQYYPVDIDYHELLSGFEMVPLSQRRTTSCLMFLYDIFKGEIRIPDLLSRININVPRPNSRQKRVFCPSKARTNILSNSIIGWATTTYNMIAAADPNIDICHQKRQEFRKCVIQAISECMGGVTTSS